MKLHLTAYANSRVVGETAWGVRRLEYAPRGEVVVRPAATVTTRGYGPRQKLKPQNLIDVLYRIEGRLAVIQGDSRIEPLPLQSGKRTLTAIKRGTRAKMLYVGFRCSGHACGGKGEGYAHANSWRVASHDAGCDACRAVVRDTAMRKAKPRVDPATTREAKRFAYLTTPLYQHRRAR